MKPEEFYVRLAELGFPLTDRQKEQYERYFELLVEWNEKINLTAITEKDEVYLKPVSYTHLTLPTTERV